MQTRSLVISSLRASLISFHADFSALFHGNFHGNSELMILRVKR